MIDHKSTLHHNVNQSMALKNHYHTCWDNEINNPVEIIKMAMVVSDRLWL